MELALYRFLSEISEDVHVGGTVEKMFILVFPLEIKEIKLHVTFGFSSFVYSLQNNFCFVLFCSIWLHINFQNWLAADL